MFSGKVVLVTGASRGIGRSIVREFSLYNAKVVINYYKEKEKAEELLDDIKTKGKHGMIIQADVRDIDSVRRMKEETLKRFGSIDILVNNASCPVVQKHFNKSSWEDYQEYFDVILKGAFNCCKEVSNNMIERRYGKIINIITVYSTGAPPSGLGAYVSAKNALVGFSKILAQELGPFGICVNMVSPGLTETDMTSNLPDKFKQIIAQQTPLKKIAQPEDIAKVVIFLASDKSDFVTGCNILTCGGVVMQ